MTNSAPQSPLVAQMWNGGWPADDEAQELRDEWYYQRAVYAYMTMLPALNAIGMRDGSQSEFGAGYKSCRSGRTGWTPGPRSRRRMPTSSIRCRTSISRRRDRWS